LTANSIISTLTPLTAITTEESDYLENLRSTAKQEKSISPRKSSRKPRGGPPGVIKVDLDLESHSISVISPSKHSSASNDKKKNLLKRSLSHSARVLTSKALKLSENPAFEAF